MSYQPDGEITTSKRTINNSDDWDSQTDWEDNQGLDDVIIEDGSIQLAARDAVIDNFELSPLGPYDSGETLDDYYTAINETMDLFDIVGSLAQDGERSMRIENTGGTSGVTCYSTTGLPNYPAPGDTWEMWLRPSEAGVNNNLVAVLFGGTSSNHYNIDLIQADNNVRIQDGNNNVLQDMAVSLNTETYYRAQHQWGNPDHTISVYDTAGTELNSMSVSDDSIGAGGFGVSTYLGGGASGMFYADGAVIL